MPDTKLFGADNNSATTVRPCEPWTFQSNIPSDILALTDYEARKVALRNWRLQDDTKHLVFSGYEGVNHVIRTNKATNPITKLHALVADFDTDITGASLMTS
jgi:hypothetical protein